ncbi:Na+/H+ antiporter subunit E [Mycoplasmatota bacterium]|nr:Na+/H+ antiporter subunit E [Mycoplasmatota bacterium]
MKYLATFLVLFASYVLLAGFEVTELAVGAVIAVILTILITKHVEYKIDYLLPYKLVVFLVVYLPVFIYQLILANIDVARRVLSPKIPLNSGFVKIKTDLDGEFGKLTLANSITLTPGTLTVDVDNDELYIHCIDVKGKSEEENRKNISSLFERVLRVVFK